MLPTPLPRWLRKVDMSDPDGCWLVPTSRKDGYRYVHATDPDLKYTPSGVAVASFRVACQRPFASSDGKKEADFLDVVAWRQQAEFAANYLGKGRKVLVEGRIQVRSYDTQDGQRRRVWEIVSENLRGLDRPKEGAENTRPLHDDSNGADDGADPFADEHGDAFDRYGEPLA